MVVVLPVVEEAWVGSSVRAAAPCRTRTTHPDADGVATLSQPPPKTCSRKLQERSSRRLRTIVRFTWPSTSTRVRFSRVLLVTRCYPRDSFLLVFERAAWKRVEYTGFNDASTSRKRGKRKADSPAASPVRVFVAPSDTWTLSRKSVLHRKTCVDDSTCG